MIWDADAAQPFVIEGAISFWPALSGPRAWRNLEYLRAAVGHHRLVPVETGAKYTDEGWSQKLMPFGDFLDTIVYPPQNTTRPESGAAKGYLAQHNLFTQACRLKRDFSLPDYTQVETGRRAVPEDCTNDNSGVLVNAWLGPRGTVSPLHYDKYDNLFAQVVGYKYVRMYAPSETGKMYPHPPESMLSNTSQVDAEAPDLQRFGMFSQALYLECIVQPGDLLYVPPSWWHYLRSLSASASISMWF
ncbi:Clavaminate synthase-like protein [Martensiomyces pterosporus]|nr:Clavaminate synthase-like protein [Martensiomyces pterosporus]